MKKLLIAFVLIMTAVSAGAYTERNLITGGLTKDELGRLLVRDQKWVPFPSYADRAGWEKLMGEAREFYIKQGEKLLDFGWPRPKATDYLEFERTGNRAIMEKPVGECAQAMTNLLLAELAEGKGRFVDQLVNGVYAAAEMTSWALSAHNVLQPSHRSIQAYDFLVIDLMAGDMGSLYSWTYYFMKDEFDKIDPEISRRLRYELQRRILDSFLSWDRYWWDGRNYNGRMLNNWTPWCESNVLMTAMLMEEDPAKYTDIAWLTMDAVDKFLNYIHGDGACEEGPSYWGHAAGKLLDYVNLISMATGGKVDVSGEKLIRDMGEYISRSYVGDGWVVNFADASARGGGDPYLIYRYGQTVGSDELKGFAALMNSKKHAPSGGRDIFRILMSLEVRDALESTQPAHSTSPLTWYPETEFCYLTTPQGLFFASKGGFNDESHNHNDAGTFSLWADNFPIFIDAGVGTYTRQTFSSERYSIWSMQSGWHSLPQINGVDQRYGRKYKAADAKASRGHFEVNIAGAYPEEAAVKSWVRRYDVKDLTLKITDRFELTEAKDPNVINFMTWGDVDASKPGVVSIDIKGHKAQLLYDASKFDASVTAKELPDPRLSNVWGSKIERISLTAKKKQTRGTYTYTIKISK
ncbi:MAG: heparinase II/III family protein [Muribaculaceae bacterium]|nr:heparinase II/III family protein [Muribaculaceae bacterium]